ncbi:cadherin-86C-like [Penaeus monodon]|uniref:cadherin-86C-like n=1 Tax=Penaeus monodon TaxID=6687 RepID=UPI0018A748A5|nr:cadherin-86C-like [Penaeus monodon]
MTTLEPILVTVTAQELTESDTLVPEKMYTSKVEIAFVIMDSDMMIPKFVHEMYVGEVRENSPPDTVVSFPVPFLKKGVRGMFALELQGDEGIFAVEPNVVRDSSAFIIKVKNPQLLDYETMTKIEFKLIAQQVSGSAQGTGTTSVRINILDVNDNMPVFTRQLYQAEIFENITAGTSIVKVQATDTDRGDFGAIRYTSLTGKLADRLQLDPLSGLITCATNSHEFDRELNPGGT